MILKEETTYIGHDDIEYDAIAEYDTESKTVTRYDYKDSNGDWVNTEELEWDENSVQQTFFKD